MRKTDQIDAERVIEVMRTSFAGFVHAVDTTYQMGWVHRVICEELDRFLQGVVNKESPRLILTVPPRHGKLCADDTPVLTTEGWKRHGDLRVGDFVFSPSGSAVAVVAVGPKEYATHAVAFSTGESIAVHPDHEWKIFVRPTREYRIVATRYFFEPSRKTGKPQLLSSGPVGKRGSRNLYQVDRPDALHMATVEHVLPSYVLGIWLGDGSSAKPCVSMSQADARIVKAEFERQGVPVNASWIHKETGVETFSFASSTRGVRNEFSAALKQLGLLKNKHIPDEYKYDSLQNRMELLAGLMDSVGYVDRTGRYKISTVLPQMADDIVELLYTCGMHPHVQTFTDTRVRKIMSRRPVICISFVASDIPCRLLRRQSHKEHNHRIAITGTTPLERPLLGNCIQVASEDGMYLVGRTLIPTHNSQLVSRCFPAYVFGRYPDMSIIATSYSSDLASRMNRDVQRIIDDERYAQVFPSTSLYGKNIRSTAKGSYLRNSDIFEIVNHAGVYRSAGVGGGITGMGADIAIIDDPVRSHADADSPTISQGLWDWYTSTLYTRLASGGGIILCLTRWNQSDLAGRLLDASRSGEGDHWKVINFPAIAEEDEYWDGKLMRHEGEALHPERYPLEMLLSIKQAIGTRDWAALYQQHPVPDGGAIFKEEWLRYWLPNMLPKKFDTVVTSWDMTFKEGSSNDFVVGQVWARAGADLFLLDQFRERAGFTRTLHAFQEMAKKWPQARRHLVEDKANGPAVIDTLKHTIPGIIPVEPDGSKVARAHAVTTYFEAGNVHVPDTSLYPWVTDFVAELTSFPSGAHDDIVDSTTQGIRDLMSRVQVRIDPAVLRPANPFVARRF